MRTMNFTNNELTVCANLVNESIHSTRFNNQNGLVEIYLKDTAPATAPYAVVNLLASQGYIVRKIKFFDIPEGQWEYRIDTLLPDSGIFWNIIKEYATPDEEDEDFTLVG